MEPKWEFTVWTPMNLFGTVAVPMSILQHLEVSDPRFCENHLRHITIRTARLQGRGDMTVFLPEGFDHQLNLPFVTLLHGVYGSHWNWAFRGGAHLTAQRLITSGEIPPLALVMPSDGLWEDGSGYVTHPDKDFEGWIVEDVPRTLEMAFPQFTPSSPRFICGLSMGGFGALRLGAKFPDKYRGIAAHSAVTHLSHLSNFIRRPVDDLGLPAGELSVIHFMLKHRQALPPIRFDCGIDDLLVEKSRKLHRDLSSAEIDHVYEEFPGGHTWEYWETHLSESLRFFGNILRNQNPIPR